MSESVKKSNFLKRAGTGVQAKLSSAKKSLSGKFFSSVSLPKDSELRRTFVNADVPALYESAVSKDSFKNYPVTESAFFGKSEDMLSNFLSSYEKLDSDCNKSKHPKKEKKEADAVFKLRKYLAKLKLKTKAVDGSVKPENVKYLKDYNDTLNLLSILSIGYDQKLRAVTDHCADPAKVVAKSTDQCGLKHLGRFETANIRRRMVNDGLLTVIVAACVISVPSVALGIFGLLVKFRESFILPKIVSLLGKSAESLKAKKLDVVFLSVGFALAAISALLVLVSLIVMYKVNSIVASKSQRKAMFDELQELPHTLRMTGEKVPFVLKSDIASFDHGHNAGEVAVLADGYTKDLYVKVARKNFDGALDNPNIPARLIRKVAKILALNADNRFQNSFRAEAFDREEYDCKSMLLVPEELRQMVVGNEIAMRQMLCEQEELLNSSEQVLKASVANLKSRETQLWSTEVRLESANSQLESLKAKWEASQEHCACCPTKTTEAEVTNLTKTNVHQESTVTMSCSD